MATLQDYTNDIRPTWCPGCGNYGIWTALKRALVEAGLEPHEVILVTGIGQSGKTNDYMNITGFHGLHGRPVPVATGYKLANHKTKVIVGHGDGDGYGEGGNHFIHAARANIGIIDMIHNNHVYGLTKGQYSPTSPYGFKTKTSPQGTFERPINALALALSQGATFVARSHTANLGHMIKVMTEALAHRGYALIEVMQVCMTFNRTMSVEYYRERAYDLLNEGHDTSDLQAAMEKAFEYPGGERIPIGIFYRDESVPAYEEQMPALAEGPLVAQPMRPRPIEDYQQLLEELI